MLAIIEIIMNWLQAFSAIDVDIVQLNNLRK